VLKRVLDRVVRDRVIVTNPCSVRSVSLPKRSQPERLVLSPAEVEKLAQAMNHESDRVLVRLLAFGGLRINECFALQGPMSILSGRPSPCVRALPTSTGV
jgi:integrase